MGWYRVKSEETNEYWYRPVRIKMVKIKGGKGIQFQEALLKFSPKSSDYNWQRLKPSRSTGLG
jgi:hypothetical protein